MKHDILSPLTPTEHLTDVSFKVTLACEDSYQSTWFTCSPPDSPGSSVFHLFSPNSPVLHPVFIRFHLLSSDITRFHLIHLFSKWFTCFPPDSPVFHPIYLFLPDFTRFHPIHMFSTPWKGAIACDITLVTTREKESTNENCPPVLLRPKRAPRIPLTSVLPRLKVKYWVITWPPKITFLFLDTFFNASGTCDALKEPVLKISF